MKKDFIQTLKILLTAVVLSLGISYAYAWTAPTDAPPAGNTPAPVNLGTDTQEKAGGFRAYGLRSFLDLIVDGGITLGGVRETTWPSVPSGAVMSFDLASCPSGWSEYTIARNRTIVGSGSTYARGTGGGASRVTLTIGQMPSHDHDFSQPAAISSAARGTLGGGDGNLNTSISFNTSSRGGNQSHENMPPFIALLYCIKS